MPDGTVRGGFELSADQPIRQLHSIRDAGREADASLEALGRRMDEIGRKRISPRVELSGVDRVKAQLAELERRLDRFDRRRATAHVGIGGGFGGAGGGGGGAGGSPLFSTLGGMAGRLPWWAAALPLGGQLLGGAGALVGSAGSAALGAGTIGLGAAGALGAGGIPTALIARNAVKDLQAVTKAQTQYNDAVQAFGVRSTQAASAKRRLDLALTSAPAGAAGAARQVAGVESAFRSATRPAYSAIYGGIAQGAYDVRRALPRVAPLVNQAASVTARSGADFAGFLTGTQSLGSYQQLVGGFARELPIAERSLQSITRLFLNLSVDALPFFHEANVWVNNWTRNLANQSQDQQRVQSRMREMVTSARDWERLLSAAGRDMRDLLSPSVAPGNSMVVTFTQTLDRWDVWLRQNPQKVRQFFDDGVRGTERIATIIGNLTSDVFQIFRAVDPILSRAEQFIRFASGLGGGSLLTGAGLLYGGYEGARRGAGLGGPSAGGLLGSFVLGGGPRPARGPAVGGAPGGVPEERGLLSRVGGGLLGFGRGALPLVGGLAALQGLTTALGTHGTLNAISAGVSTGVSQASFGMISPHAVHPAALSIAAAALPALALPALSRVGAAPLASMATLPGVGRAAPLLARLASVGMLGRVALGGALGVPAAYAGFMLNPDNAGATLGSQRGFMQSVSAQAGAVRTPAQMRALDARVAPQNVPLRFEMSPGDARRFSTFLRTAAATAATNAGAYASNTWETAFSRGLDTMGPNRAVTTMLGGMQRQVQQLGPAGSRAFAGDVASWASQIVQSNPRLEAPISRLMRGIVRDVNTMSGAVTRSFSDIHKMVFYFNGQILQGSANTWKAIGTALTDPASVAQEKLSGIFGAIQTDAINALESMGYSRSAARGIVLNLGKASSATHQAGDIARNTLRSAQGQNVSGTVMTSTGQNIYLTPTKARGGVIGGRGLLDTVPTPDGGLAAPGEAWIANRHTMNDLSRATVAMYGKTAWQMIHDEGRPHSAPPRYRAATGTGLPPIIQANGVAGHPELKSGISRAVAAVLGMFPGLQITSTTGGTHAKGSYHYLGEAADIASDTGTMFRAAAWINSSGLARQLTEGIHNPNLSVKYGRGVPPSYWGGPTWAQHLNHIHMAVAGGANVGALTGGMVGGGGASGALARPISLRAPRSNMAGVPGAMLDAASAAMTLGMQRAVNRRSGAVGISGAGFTGGGSSRANQALGQRMMLAAGWPMSEWPSLLKLWNQESGWDSNSVNRSSGAYGIPQALGHGHPFNLGDAPAQIAWGLNYIRGRYGSPSGAWAHEVSHNWYQRGGRLNWAGWNAKGGEFVTHGPTVFGAGENGRRERVSITPIGHGGGREINVHFNGPVYARDEREVEALGELVAGKIMDALDRVGSGTSDGELMAGAA